MIYAKCVFLLAAVFFTIVNIGRTYSKNDLPAVNLILQAIGITGFIMCQWII